MALSESESKQKAYYERIAADYDHHYGSKYALVYRNQVFDTFFDGRDFDGLTVLDAMSGGGENSGYFSTKKAIVYGLDISQAQCRFYKKRHQGYAVICASVLNSSFPDNTFDLVITESLHHLHPHVNAGVVELCRILKPGGQLIIWEPSSGSLLDAVRKLWYKLDKNYFEDNEASIDIDRLTARFRQSLQLVKTEYGGNLAHLFVMSSMHFRIPQGLVNLYAPLFVFLEKHLQKIQGRFFSCWVLALYEKK